MLYDANFFWHLMFISICILSVKNAFSRYREWHCVLVRQTAVYCLCFGHLNTPSMKIICQICTQIVRIHNQAVRWRHWRLTLSHSFTAKVTFCYGCTVHTLTQIPNQALRGHVCCLMVDWTQTVCSLFIYQPVNSTAQALWNALLDKMIDPSLFRPCWKEVLA